MPQGYTTRPAQDTLCEQNSIDTLGRPRRRLRGMGLAATLAAGLALSGCASPIIGALTIGEISTIAGLVSTFMSGRDLTEHALSAATGKDCRILESLLRPERDFCEVPGSEGTAGDFEGVIALLDGGSATALAQADIEVQRATDPLALGFAPIDRRIAVDGFSLDVVENQSERRAGHRVAFGMLQASYGQSWSYELTTRRDTREASAAPKGEQMASAAPAALPATRTDGAVIVPEPVAN